MAGNRLHGLACLVAFMLAAGCGGSAGDSASPVASADRPGIATGPSPPPSAPPLFADAASGVSILPVPGMHLRRDFARRYLGGDGWKADAESDGDGTPLVALVMDGSNGLTAAELRIGYSAEANAVAACETVPAYAEPAGGERAVVDGVPFRRFTWSDAAMSHYMQVEAYRAVRNGKCLAIDLLLTGTRPEVYDPPRQPPFGRDQAWAKLREALSAVSLGG